MKKIKVKYCKYDKFDENTPLTYNYFIHNILKKYYDVEVSDNPDYVFYHESTYDYLKYNCIRIFYTAENVSPNFNLCDYAISNDYINFEDRHYRLASYLVATFYQKKELELAKDIDITKPKIFTKEDLAKKTDFCSFVYSNYLADERRKILFDKIYAYKKVDAGGKYLNNIGGPTDNKLGFEMKHKFSMAIENSSRNGYTTDRIVCSFMANTIPIYWGNPEIGREFNTKRFINCHDYKTFDEAVERVKEIDNNDELYLKIINEPLFAEDYSFEKATNGLEKFLRNIFDQPIENASRRTINMARSVKMEKNEKIIERYTKKQAKIKKLLAKLYQPFKKIKSLENFKENYFRKKILK
ncbi:MAG: glycosyltransferase family 10 [Minisyncoccia bacterium]